MIPTSWLLSVFLNPDIYHETDLWTMGITDRLIDRLIVEGNASFVIFFVLALLQWKQSELLAITSLDGLIEAVQALPWSLSDTDITQVILTAESLLAYTSVCTVCSDWGIVAVFSWFIEPFCNSNIRCSLQSFG